MHFENMSTLWEEIEKCHRSKRILTRTDYQTLLISRKSRGGRAV